MGDVHDGASAGEVTEDGEREPFAVPDPEEIAKDLIVLWWDARVAHLYSEAERYKVIDYWHDVYENMVRMLREERARAVQLVRKQSATWGEVSAELGRPDSTLRSQAAKK